MRHIKETAGELQLSSVANARRRLMTTEARSSLILPQPSHYERVFDGLLLQLRRCPGRLHRSVPEVLQGFA
jgi:hypothetical protein